MSEKDRQAFRTSKDYNLTMDVKPKILEEMPNSNVMN